jgi:hypothetical protein
MRALAERNAPFTLVPLRGDPMRSASALAMLEAGLRRLAGILDGEPIERQREKLRARVAETAIDAEQVAVFLGELAYVPFPDDALSNLAPVRARPAQLGDQMLAAFVDFFAAECARAPVVIVVDDLHWSDPLSVRYLDALLADARVRPLLVLALARPEVYDTYPRLWHGRDVVEVKLAPLRPRAAEALVTAVLGDVDGATQARIVAQAEGSPFYLEEIIRAVAEERGAALPETVMAMIQARLARLPASARSLLRAGSIFGKVFWRGACAALVDDAVRAKLDQGLALLKHSEILVERPRPRFHGEEELAFRHDLLRDGAYSLLTEADRELGHRLAGAWLERAGEVDAVVLAEHFERGGLREKTFKLHLVAAEQAFERGDLETTLVAAERGLAAGATGNDRAALERARDLAQAERDTPTSAPRPAAQPEPEPEWHFDILDGAPILHVVCVGRWSKEVAQRYVDEQKANVAPLIGRPWGYLCNLDRWLPTHPDAAELIVEFLLWTINSGMARVAYIISDVETRLRTRLQIQRIFDEVAGLRVIGQFFATDEEGERWLRAQVYAK